ncbi:hypothetical protein POM88_015473 [Heracleum sosnowskyi]|uniref:EF-hand domain-containing protein n=1 Tax=Heracleum sosnowskyi TaxID=360622 RepID=A0AAD8INT8_9APIA|nr:hypothetical protein POM88_015473 [Heracleum sosnowskyi]
MDNLRKIANIYYHALPEEDKLKVSHFMTTMDKDGSGKADLVEFKQYLKEQGYDNYADSDFFKKLDINRDKRLDTMEMLTLYYSILSGRPFCRRCGDFIMAEYFVCVECFEKCSAPIYLCSRCYKDRKYRHSHGINENPLFLDNYAMLEYNRVSALTKKKRRKLQKSESKASFTITTFSTSSSLVSSSKASSNITSELKEVGAVAFKTFETALGLANLKLRLTALGIGAGCTIM